MKPTHPAQSVSRRQVLTTIAAGTICITTGAAAVTVLDVVTAATPPRLDPHHATSTAPFILSF